jgi:small subunit ribosomal protein S16
MLSIRMRRTGSKKRPYYRVVVTEARDPREGAFKEILGTYNPRSKPATVEVNRERLTHWIKVGARPSDSVRTLIARHLTKDRSVIAEGVTAEPVAPRGQTVPVPASPPERAEDAPPETPSQV